MVSGLSELSVGLRPTRSSRLHQDLRNQTKHRLGNHTVLQMLGDSKICWWQEEKEKSHPVRCELIKLGS